MSSAAAGGDVVGDGVQPEEAIDAMLGGKGEVNEAEQTLAEIGDAAARSVAGEDEGRGA